MGSDSVATGDSSTNPPVVLWYHVATMGDYRRVVAEQGDLLDRSGLLAAASRLVVRVSGDGPLPELPGPAEVIRNPGPIGRGECPTLEALRSFARGHPRGRVLYFHAKGVSWSDGPEPQRTNVGHWRRYLEYWCVERWRDCLAALDDHDAAGAEWLAPEDAGWFPSAWGGPWPWPGSRGLFAGNFWWARLDYLARLPDRPLGARHDAEWFFVAEGGPRVRSFHRAGVGLYDVAYPRARYAAEGGP